MRILLTSDISFKNHAFMSNDDLDKLAMMADETTKTQLEKYKKLNILTQE